jgi:hypothetical protein
MMATIILNQNRTNSFSRQRIGSRQNLAAPRQQECYTDHRIMSNHAMVGTLADHRLDRDNYLEGRPRSSGTAAHGVANIPIK